MSSSNPFRRIIIENSFNTAAGSGALIEWELEDWLVDTGPWVFSVEKSWRTDADWEVVAEVTDLAWAYDVSPSEAGVELQTYYQVVLTTGDRSTYSSGPVQAGVRHDTYEWRILRELVRKHTMIFSRHRGGGIRKGFLLRIPTFGEASANIDPNTRDIVDENSELDYGTGYAAGYWAPIPANILSTGEKLLTRLTADRGVINGVSTQAMVLAYPKFRADDIWVDAATDERYRVGGSIATTVALGSTPIVQTIPLTRLGADNVAYRVPVPRGS